MTQVCSYDRAGYGWSDVGPSPRTSSQISSDLHLLLQKAGVQTALVLVGHSLGGLYVRYYAARYPAEVAGMVPLTADYGFLRMTEGEFLVEEGDSLKDAGDLDRAERAYRERPR